MLTEIQVELRLKCEKYTCLGTCTQYFILFLHKKGIVRVFLVISPHPAISPAISNNRAAHKTSNDGGQKSSFLPTNPQADSEFYETCY